MFHDMAKAGINWRILLIESLEFSRIDKVNIGACRAEIRSPRGRLTA